LRFDWRNGKIEVLVFHLAFRATEAGAVFSYGLAHFKPLSALGALVFINWHGSFTPPFRLLDSVVPLMVYE